MNFHLRIFRLAGNSFDPPGINGESTSQRSLGHFLAGVILAIALPWSSVALAADATDLDLSVKTDKSRYDLGEPVDITVSTCNPTPEVITAIISGDSSFNLEILNDENMQVASSGGGGLPAFFTLIWQPGECMTEGFEWAQNTGFVDDPAPADLVGEGSYFVHYEWFPNTFIITVDSPDFLIGSFSIPTMSHTAAIVLACSIALAGLLSFRRHPKWRGL